jgi:hypothetical protein
MSDLWQHPQIWADTYAEIADDRLTIHFMCHAPFREFGAEDRGWRTLHAVTALHYATLADYLSQ